MWAAGWDGGWVPVQFKHCWSNKPWRLSGLRNFPDIFLLLVPKLILYDKIIYFVYLNPTLIEIFVAQNMVYLDKYSINLEKNIHHAVVGRNTSVNVKQFKLFTDFFGLISISIIERVVFKISNWWFLFLLSVLLCFMYFEVVIKCINTYDSPLEELTLFPSWNNHLYSWIIFLAVKPLSNINIVTPAFFWLVFA